ncbi:ATP-binding protein [Actinoplanes sp. NBRC 103695]|uniref:sensor histidine kinase n=1 Tax=Actinoplanes sp. NBRC 103695 TaxID=3032202 RepID=UPI0024A1028A|nr:ATP-binding protein [Actinoplanes sp. NBRC 103695]GLY96762.1 sensor protein CutS [Actinoplanes sp. NBRC 103695]
MRLRLTLVYGGLFLLAGLLLLAVTSLLVSKQLPTKIALRVENVRPPQPGVGGDTTFVQRFAEDARDDALSTILTQGGIALIVVASVAIALGWLIAGLLLQPLNRITAAARRIADAPAADGRLRERIALDGPDDEIKRLADTFDLMLTRLDHAFDGQRRFIANASHELRTPLTLNRTLLEVALTPPQVAPEMRQLGDTLLAINDRHGRLIDGLLMLGRSEREPARMSYVDLADVADHVAETADTKLAEAPVLGDPILLERMVQNLVENGLRHNVPGGWVCVVTGTYGPHAFIEVGNTGPVVPPYEVEGLFEPFRRLGTERLASPGAGLGLSIVRAVARAHGGDARAVARPDGGLVVTVTLPRVADPM